MRASEVRATLDATGRGESELRSHDGFEGTIARPSHLSPGHTGERFPPGAREATRRRLQMQKIFLPPGWEGGAGPAINGSVCPPGRPSVFLGRWNHGLKWKPDSAAMSPVRAAMSSDKAAMSSDKVAMSSDRVVMSSVKAGMNPVHRESTGMVAGRIARIPGTDYEA